MLALPELEEMAGRVYPALSVVRQPCMVQAAAAEFGVVDLDTMAAMAELALEEVMVIQPERLLSRPAMVAEGEEEPIVLRVIKELLLLDIQPLAFLIQPPKLTMSLQLQLLS